MGCTKYDTDTTIIKSNSDLLNGTMEKMDHYFDDLPSKLFLSYPHSRQESLKKRTETEETRHKWPKYPNIRDASTAIAIQLVHISKLARARP